MAFGRKIGFIFLGIIFTVIPLSAVETTPTILRYGLLEKSFDLNIPNKNPFDSQEIRVDAQIRIEDENPITIPCYFEGGTRWKLRFTPARAGNYTYRIAAAFPQSASEIVAGAFTVQESPARGFLRVSSKSPRFFAFDNGESYFPLGENLGWVSPPQLSTWIGYLDECRQAGINWIRIWMCSWGRTELEWTPEGNHFKGLGQYDLNHAKMIDGIFQAAEERGIYIQWVINHHGQYSIETNPIWNANPYNIANGGFLTSPEQFFTHEEAKRHYRDRLRYLVARWGYSPNLMAWEFWNEVDLTANFNLAAVKSWHEEMAAYLDTLDPYHHLRTTSAGTLNDQIHTISGLQYLQNHRYSTDYLEKMVEISAQKAKAYPDRPHFFGELSYDWRGPNTGDKEGVILHNQLWASALSCSSGTGMTWWWDNWVRPYNLYSHFQMLAKFLQGVDWIHENWLPIPAEIAPRPENLGPFSFAPGLDWQSTDQKEFVVRTDGVVENLDRCTMFVHGQYHRDMAPNPVFVVQALKPTHFGFQIGVVARSGATCQVYVDDNLVFKQVFAPAANDVTMGDAGKISVAVPEGAHRIAIKNPGSDWIRIDNYRLDEYIQRPIPYARGNDNHLLVWIHDNPHQYALLSEYVHYNALSPTTLTFPTIRSGEFSVERFDPYSGEITPMPSVRAGETGLTIEAASFQKDAAFRLRRVNTAVNLYKDDQ